MTNENINGNEAEKLLPENESEQMYVNAVLGWCRGLKLECNTKHEKCWREQKTGNSIELWKWVDYRIKPKQTPLPIPGELWKLINPEFKFAAMDKNGFVCVYEASPIIAYNDRWVAENENYGSLKAFNINTDGIDWRLSLTKRPEGL